MIELSKERLQKEGFEPMFPSDWNGTPQYAQLVDPKNRFFVFVQHLTDKTYFIHRARDSDFRGYDEQEINAIPPLSDLDFPGLIKFLINPKGLNQKV
jgi:hypothetical protein